MSGLPAVLRERAIDAYSNRICTDTCLLYRPAGAGEPAPGFEPMLVESPVADPELDDEESRQPCRVWDYGGVGSVLSGDGVRTPLSYRATFPMGADVRRGDVLRDIRDELGNLRAEGRALSVVNIWQRRSAIVADLRGAV